MPTSFSMFTDSRGESRQNSPPVEGGSLWLYRKDGQIDAPSLLGWSVLDSISSAVQRDDWIDHLRVINH